MIRFVILTPGCLSVWHVVLEIRADALVPVSAAERKWAVWWALWRLYAAWRKTTCPLRVRLEENPVALWQDAALHQESAATQVSCSYPSKRKKWHGPRLGNISELSIEYEYDI